MRPWNCHYNDDSITNRFVVAWITTLWYCSLVWKSSEWIYIYTCRFESGQYKVREVIEKDNIELRLAIMPVDINYLFFATGKVAMNSMYCLLRLRQVLVISRLLETQQVELN